MKRNCLSFAMFCFIVIFCMPLFSSAEDVPADVLKAAEEGLQIFVKELPKNRLPRFGFLNEQDIADATVGQGFQSFVVASDSLLNDAADISDLNSMLVPLNKWQFLIMTRDKAAAILTVYLDNDEWKPGSIGAPDSTEELNIFIKTWPAASGFSYRLIYAYEGRPDFIELSTSAGVKGVIPLTSARYSMKEEKKDFDPSDLRNAGNIAKKIKTDAREKRGSRQNKKYP